jgi:hypothetical protein
MMPVYRRYVIGVADMGNAIVTVPEELIACVSGGTAPTSGQLTTLAARIWSEGASHRSAFSWGELAPDAGDRLFALRSAALALNGN